MAYEVTEIGEVTGFVAIEKPSTKFNEDGTYSCKLVFSGKSAKIMKDKIDGYMAAAKAETRAKGNAAAPYKIVGKTLVVNFKNKAVIKKRTGETINVMIRLFDAKNKEVSEPMGIGVGSKVKIAYTVYSWSNPSQGGAGITLQPAMVQVIDLVKASFGGGSEGSPFGEEEGYAAEKSGNPFDEPEAEAPAETVEEDDIDF